MSYLRLIGLAVGLAILWFAVAQYRARRYRKGEFALAFLVAASLLVVSLAPGIVDALTTLFRVPTRLMALSIIGNLVLFVLVLVLFRHVAQLRTAMSDLVRSLARNAYATEADAAVTESVTAVTGGIVVVIPAYDEQPNLERMLPTLPPQACGMPLRALVVADGGRDGTASVARRLAAGVTSHAINRGQGDALRTGFDLALQEGAEVVVTMDADGQHKADEIARLVKPILDDEADFVLGTRIRGEYEDRGGARHAGIIVFSLIISWLVGTRVTDCTNGFRAIRASGLKSLELRESRFNAPELLIEASARGLRIREMPVTIRGRDQGESKKPASWRYPIGFTLAVVRAWLRS